MLMKKHAFMLIAHKNFEQLNRLISLLDNPRIDIFLHIDKRSPKYTPPKCKASRIFLLPRIKTNWGGYSLVECELNLLETALTIDSYAFLHLLSGQDLPIKPIDDILSFFDSHSCYNFIHYDNLDASVKRIERIKYYYPFQDIKPRGRSVWSVSQKLLVLIQQFIGIDRTKKYVGEFKSGSQWWTIKPELAVYIISKKNNIATLFKYTMCDEMFMQTLVYNSPFYETVYIKEDDCHANERLIDFSNGDSHIWTMRDFERIRNSDLLFARKFDESVDKKVIVKIIQLVN